MKLPRLDEKGVQEQKDIQDKGLCGDLYMVPRSWEADWYFCRRKTGHRGEHGVPGVDTTRT